MLWQVAFVENDFGIRANSALAMGQGEPLANYAALAEALGFMSSAQGFGIEQRNLVVSTCGIPDGIRAFAEDGVPAALAVSLHTARQKLRDELMPSVRAYTLERLHRELARYNEVTGRRVYVHYLMLDGVNDQDADFEALEEFCRGLDVNVVFLNFNRADGIPFAPSTFGRMFMWSAEFNRRGISARINKPRGADINGGCGQLAGTVLHKMRKKDGALITS
jgi:23S rRNA (adenine2503-C2)-methyltransferase